MKSELGPEFRTGQPVIVEGGEDTKFDCRK